MGMRTSRRPTDTQGEAIWRMDICFERVATSLEHGIFNTMQVLSMCLSKHVPPMHLTGSPDLLS